VFIFSFLIFLQIRYIRKIRSLVTFAKFATSATFTNSLHSQHSLFRFLRYIRCFVFAACSTFFCKNSGFARNGKIFHRLILQHFSTAATIRAASIGYSSLIFVLRSSAPALYKTNDFQLSPHQHDAFSVLVVVSLRKIICV